MTLDIDNNDIYGTPTIEEDNRISYLEQSSMLDIRNIPNQNTSSSNELPNNSEDQLG